MFVALIILFIILIVLICVSSDSEAVNATLFWIGLILAFSLVIGAITCTASFISNYSGILALLFSVIAILIFSAMLVNGFKRVKKSATHD